MTRGGSRWPKPESERGVGRPAAVVALTLAMALLIAACGGGGTSSQEVQQQVAAALQKQKKQQELKNLKRKVKQLQHGPTGTTVSPGSGGSSSSGSTGSCGGGVSAGANTSCGFAEAVASAYRESGGPVVRALSPTTHQTYAMTCSGSNPVVCRGGNDASVYIY